MTDQPNPVHDTDDAEGHKAAFVVDVPHASDEDDDAEGHISGAVRVDPSVPSAMPDANAVHPKSH